MDLHRGRAEHPVDDALQCKERNVTFLHWHLCQLKRCVYKIIKTRLIQTRFLTCLCGLASPENQSAKSGMKRFLVVLFALAAIGLVDSFMAPFGQQTIFNRATVKKSANFVPNKLSNMRPSGTSSCSNPRIFKMQSSSSVTSENPIKVIVAGGGVGGLFLAKALQKKGCTVTVLEKTSKFARFGGPIQLASNALATIKGIDEDLFQELMQKFTFTGTRTCGIKDGIRSTTENPQWYTKFEAITNMADYFSLPYTGVVDRPDLQVCLARR
jgi:hypothetical protein